MFRMVGLTLSLALAPTSLMATEVDISVGSELFLWQEFADNGDRYLDETGARHFVNIEGLNHFHPLWGSRFAGRFYSGVVEYDGQTHEGNPVKTDVDYNGMRLEIGLSRRVGMLARQSDQPQWWLDFALGNDFWRRNLRNSTLANDAPVFGYVERYSSIYGRLGANYQGASGWSVAVGAKLPLHTTQEVKIDGSILTLNPEGRLSLYGNASYALNQAWKLSLSYDSYRFAKSDEVYGYTHIYYQPESTQDSLALAAHYRF